MAITERAVVTALPAGLATPEAAERAVGDRDARLAVVTAFVTPRVDVGGADVLVRDLDAFAIWPNALDAWDLGVEVDGRAATVLGRVEPPRPDPDLWERLFEQAGVQTRAFEDLSEKGLLTAPASDIAAFVGTTYAAFTAPTFPTEQTLAALDHALGRGRRKLTEIDPRELAGMLDGIYADLDGAPPGPARTGLALDIAERFYHRPEAERPLPAGVAIEDHLKALEAKKPEYDFHQLCAAMGDYPLLLRALGLAVDLLLDEGELGDKGWVAIRPADQGPVHLIENAASLPRTRYHHEPDERIFVADDRDASPDPGIRRGMLDLRGHRLSTLDVDSAAPQVAQVLANATRRQRVLDEEGGTRPKATPSSLPALRTGGITVLRAGRRGVLAGSLGRSKRHEDAVTTTDVPPVLWSDDVTRGWRLDVLDRDSAGAAEWLSLGARTGAYLFAGDRLALEGEEFEAYLKSASASTDTVQPVILYTSEAVAGWDGWSLAARRPGRAIGPGGAFDQPDDTPLDGFPLVVTFRPVAGSLPLLRFGRTYQLRVRAADLAGNGHRLRSAPDGYESDPIVMTRWEPVPPPEVVPLVPFGEGESLLRVVLRSTRDVAPRDYVELPRVLGLAGHPAAGGAVAADWRYRAVAARHLLAPKEAQQQAERHGGFDAAFGGGDPAVLWPLLRREEATFYNLPGAILVQQDDPEAVVPFPDSEHRGQELGPHRYLTAPDRPAAAPYLPDHLATGIAIHDLPGFPVADPLRVGLAGPAGGPAAWPDHRAALIEVVEGPQGASVDDGTGVVTVSLPKAEVRHIRLSSVFPDSALPMLAVWERVVHAYADGTLTSPALGEVETAARRGRLWTLTPWIDMTLVHAVEKPLAEPDLDLPGDRAHRLEGETFASLAGQVHVHAKSTGRVDIDAAWTEPRDDIGRPPTIDPSTWAAGGGHVVGFDVRADEDAALVGRDAGGGTHVVRHELGDTKHRMIDYTTTATTRFREYFPPAITDDPALITTASTERIDVPSSRRPDPPDVAYVVPIFGWDEARYGRARIGGQSWPPAFRRTRRGGGLRIYLRRPWWSSGAGERLAVVLPNQRSPFIITELGELFRPSRSAANVERVAGTLAERLGEAGVRGASAAKLARAIKRTEVAGGEGEVGHAQLVSMLHDAIAGAGIEVARPTLERVWGEVGAAIEVGPSVFLPGSSLNEAERSAFVTRWGRDPTAVAGNPTLSPRIADFLDRDGHAVGLRLAHPAGERVAVATYEPQFDAERDLWFVDIHLAEHDHFMPFIRLALARYQAHAIGGCELSEVRVGDFMQLMPTREVTVRDFGGDVAHVTVRGRGGYGALAEATSGLPTDLARVGRTLYVRAWVEQHRSSSPTDLDWVPATKHDTWLTLDRLDAGWRARWLGQVPLPEPKRGYAYRLALEELQVHETDEQNLARDPDRFGAIEGAGGRSVPVGLRLLYADRIALTVVEGRIGPDAPDRA